MVTVFTEFPFVVRVNIWIRIISCLRLRSEISRVRVIIFRLRENLYSGNENLGNLCPTLNIAWVSENKFLTSQYELAI